MSDVLSFTIGSSYYGVMTGILRGDEIHPAAEPTARMSNGRAGCNSQKFNIIFIIL